MKSFFSPAAFLTSRLPYKKKFIVLGLLYIISIAVVASSLYARLDTVIGAARQELQGVKLIIPIMEVIQQAQLHRGLSLAVASGNQTLLEKRQLAGRQTQEAVVALEQQFPGPLLQSERWREIKAQWLELRDSGHTLPQDANFDAHTRMIYQLRMLGISVADHYGLTFDPEMSSHYLLDTVIENLPHTLEHLGQLRALGTASLTRANVSELQRAKALALTFEAHNQVQILVDNLTKSAQLVPELKPVLLQVSKDISSQTYQIADYLQAEMLSMRYSVPPENFFLMATTVIDNGFAQINQSLVPAIESMIQERIKRAERELLMTIGFAFLLMLLVGYFVTGIFHSTMDSIGSLRLSAQKFAGGDMKERVRLTTEDEIGQVGHSFNEMADGFNDLLNARIDDQERVNAIINSALDAMVQIDSNGLVTGWSQQAEKCFGWTHDQVIGAPLHEKIIPQRYRDAHANGVRRYALTGHGPVLNNSRIEIEGLHRDGHEFPLELSISPIKTSRGVEFSAFIRDVTVRKQSERDLLKAREVAETANLAKSAFLANMSHEIRTPMNAIIGLTHILGRTEPTPAQTEQLTKIENAARHLMAIINDILDISKIEAGRLELEQTDFHLGILLDNVYSLIADQARIRGLAVQVDPDSAPLWLRGDPTRVRQALLNFASNAIKFTDTGFVALRAHLLEESDKGILLRFEVEDTGIGIPVEAQSHLFKAFEQADVSTTRKYGGTGLGLAITQRLAQLMGGEAGFSTTPGQGSTFWFTAWMQRGQGIMPEQTSGQADNVEIRLHAHAGVRILVVDDVSVNREVAKMLLEQVGLMVDMAENGREAVDMVRARPYPLILMDVQMPVMDGMDATRQIHALPGRAEQRVLAMTANAFDEDRRACLSAGMIDFVPKPVDPNVLYRTLLRWLEKHGDAPARNLQPLSVGDPDKAASATVADAPILEPLPGLDIESGMRIWRKADIYGKFLRKFAVDYADSARTMRQAIADGDSGAAASLAHKMKGAAANLALTDVARLAGETDRGLKGGDDVSGLLDQLQRALDTARSSIDRYAPETNVLAETDALSSEQQSRVTILLDQLLTALDADNPDSVEPVFAELGTLLSAARLRTVGMMLSDFDFRGAEEATWQLAEELGLSLRT